MPRKIEWTVLLIITFLFFPFFAKTQSIYPPKKLDGKWGIWNDSKKGCWLFDPVYDLVEQFDGYYKLYEGKKVGLFADGFKLQLSPQFEDVYFDRRSNLITVMKNGKWGMIDGKGEILMAYKYDEMVAMGKTLIKVKLGEKYGLIDFTGKEVLTAKFDDLEFWEEGNPYREKLIQATLETKKGLLDVDGNWWLNCHFEDINSSLFISQRLSKPDQFPIKNNTHWGFANIDGDIVIECKYLEVSPFHRGVAIVRLPQGNYGLINEKGNALHEQEYTKITGFHPISNISQVELGNKKMGLINLEGTEILPPDNYQIEPVYDPIQEAENRKRRGKSSRGTAKDFIARDEFDFTLFKYLVSEKDESKFIYKIGLISADKKIDIPPTEGVPLKGFRYGFFDVLRNISLVNQEQIFPSQFEEVKHYLEELFIVRSDGKYGVYDVLNSKFLIPCIYDNVVNGSNHLRIPIKCNSDYFIVIKDGKRGMVDRANKVIIPFEFNELIKIPKHNVVIAKKIKENNATKNDIHSISSKRINDCSLLKMDGEQLTSEYYEEIHLPNFGMFGVSRAGKPGFINSKGEEIIPCGKFNCGYSFNLYSKEFKVNYQGNSLCESSNIPNGFRPLASYTNAPMQYFINLQGELIDSVNIRNTMSGGASMGLDYKNGEYVLMQRRSFVDNLYGKDIDPKLVAALIETNGGFCSIRVVDGISTGYFFYKNSKHKIFDQVQVRGNIDDKIRWVRLEEYFGFVNDLGEMVTPIHFEKVGPLSEGMICVVRDGKVGFLDSKGALVIPFDFEDDYNKIPQFKFLNGTAVVRQNGKYGIIDYKGQVLVPFQFDGIIHHDSNRVIGIIDSEWKSVKLKLK